jgi:hypothetical protein
LVRAIFAPWLEPLFRLGQSDLKHISKILEADSRLGHIPLKQIHVLGYCSTLICQALCFAFLYELAANIEKRYQKVRRDKIPVGEAPIDDLRYCDLYVSKGW